MISKKQVEKNDFLHDYSSFKISSVSISPENFMKLPSYNCNRFVESRVTKMVKRLSKEPLPTHLVVAVCKVTENFGPYKKGQIFRLDGHTRTDTWKVNPWLTPNVDLLAIVYEIDNKKYCKKVYDEIDSQESTENSNDKITGLLRERNFIPQSNRLKKGTFKTAVINACRYLHTPEGVYLNGKEYNDKFDVKLDYLWEELIFIDKMGIDDIQRYSTNVLTSFLLMAKKYGAGNKRLEMLIDNYKEGNTTTNTSAMVDGVHYVYNVLYLDNQKMWGQTGFSNSFDLLSQILYSFDMFMKNENISKKTRFPTKKILREYYKNFIK